MYDGAAGVFLPANKRPIGMVFQSYAIWPHMSVLAERRVPADRRRRTARRARRRASARCATLDLVGLADVADRPATALSGGQQQRVALARALVREPKVLLLDEPLSNLDAQLRERMRGEIRAVQQALGITAVYVTHDQNEALAISDLIMLMDGGAIVETGVPQQIYRRPRAEFTANFIGVANAFDGTVRASDASGLVVQTRAGRHPRRARSPICAPATRVRVFVRPENIELSRKRHGDDDWTGHRSLQHLPGRLLGLHGRRQRRRTCACACTRKRPGSGTATPCTSTPTAPKPSSCRCATASSTPSPPAQPPPRRLAPHLARERSTHE